jgi:hypothetical protein
VCQTENNPFCPTWQEDVRGNPKIISKAQKFKADLDEEEDIKVPTGILLK